MPALPVSVLIIVMADLHASIVLLAAGNPAEGRKTKLKNDTDKYIQDLALMYNNTPRKCLGYQTPNQVIINEIGAALEM